MVDKVTHGAEAGGGFIFQQATSESKGRTGSYDLHQAHSTDLKPTGHLWEHLISETVKHSTGIFSILESYLYIYFLCEILCLSAFKKNGTQCMFSFFNN